MDFVRFKLSVDTPKPETRYLKASDEEIQAGGPFDAARGRNLAPGETFQNPVETRFGPHTARFEAAVRFSLETCDAGRCAECRDNSRVRYIVRATDQHGVRKWCGPCLNEKLSADVPP